MELGEFEAMLNGLVGGPRPCNLFCATAAISLGAVYFGAAGAPSRKPNLRRPIAPAGFLFSGKTCVSL